MRGDITKENYGDLLGRYLVENISKKKVVFAEPKNFSVSDFFSPIYVTVGSILLKINHKCIVWGSGIINKNHKVRKAKKFLAVRGPQTRKRLLELGYEVPEIFGDPAILLPKYYNPPVEKKYRWGIAPHFVDYDETKKIFTNRNDVSVIDLITNDIEATTDKFLQCEKIISSSLHGVIISHAYGIPAVWQKFSNKLYGDNIKFQDYFESVNINFYQSTKFDPRNLDQLFKNVMTLPNEQHIEELRNQLLACCPFKQM